MSSAFHKPHGENVRVYNLGDTVYLKGTEDVDGSVRWFYETATGLPVDQLRVDGVWESIFIVDALNGQFVFDNDGVQVTL